MDTIKNKTNKLRELIREILIAESGPTMASGTDPINAQGFYSYELSRGNTDNFWYRSPGRSMGTEGDPGRPPNANLYVGMETPTADAESESESEISDLSPGVEPNISIT